MPETRALVQWRRKILRLVAVIFGCAVVAFAMAGISYVRIGNTADDVADQQTVIVAQQETIARQQKQIRELLAAVQSSRFDATLRACQFRNDQNGGIRFIVRRAPPELQQVVAARFPVEPDCVEYARESVAVRPRPRTP